MKKEDKITVEITLAELAQIYAVMGKVNGSTYCTLYGKGKNLLDPDRKALDQVTHGKSKADFLNFSSYENQFFDLIFNKKTEAQLKIEELQATIEKAQQQIEQLKEMK